MEEGKKGARQADPTDAKAANVCSDDGDGQAANFSWWACFS